MRRIPQTVLCVTYYEKEKYFDTKNDLLQTNFAKVQLP